MSRKTISNEIKLIIYCVRPNIISSSYEKIRELLIGLINWDKIIAISTHHQVLPFLYYTIKKTNLQNLVPRKTFQIIENCYYSNLAKNSMIEKEIIRISELAKRENIKTIPFRGFSLMQTLYKNPGLRIMADVDMLIEKNNLQKIDNILERLGYHRTAEEKDYHVSLFSKMLLPNLSLYIEIHEMLVPPRPYTIQTHNLWQRAQEKNIGKGKLLYLSNEDTFLSTVLHLRRHTRRISLKPIVDLAELLNKHGEHMDWVYIKKVSKRSHFISSVYLSLYITKELFDISIPYKISVQFKPRIIKRHFINMLINRYNFFSFKKESGTLLRFLLFDSLLDILLYLWRVSLLERLFNKKYTEKQNNYYKINRYKEKR